MRCTTYRTDPPTLVAALTQIELLQRYQDALALETKSLADRTLLRHVRRMSTLASQVMVGGFETVARNDLAGADELLTDLFAVATWHDWDLPAERLGEQELPVDDLPRGLLAADQGAESAKLWLLDGTTVALSRARESGDQAEMPGG